MSIFLRIWLAFAIVLLAGSYFTFSAMQNQIKPSVRQVVEETLADNANIIASLIAEDVANGQVQTPAFGQKIREIQQRKLGANIWHQHKDHINQQFYITDNHGIVIYDSQGLAVGQDYSRWNDVYLTLHGRYGVRATRTDPEDYSTSTMYVAAPILWHGQLIGVVTLSKPGISVQPYINATHHEMLVRALWIVLISLACAALIAWWLRHGIDQVRRYAVAMTPQEHQDRTASTVQGKDNTTLPIKPAKPLRFWVASELNELTQAIDRMQVALTDQAYVEHYVHTLTHELKSPLSAITASAELLQDELPADDRLRFARNIQEQTIRLQHLVERLLLLAQLEKRNAPMAGLEKQPLPLLALCQRLLAARHAPIQSRQIHISLEVPADLLVQAEPFWLAQAIGNVLDNAIDFTPEGRHIVIRGLPADGTDPIRLQIENEGEPIPEYALPQVFDRYFSLPRPHTQQKSTGIGLTLVREVMALHQGHVTIDNLPQGVQVTLSF